MLRPLTELLVGFAILSVGGHLLVRGAVKLALLSGVSTAVVGLTVVACGTSLPEMAVSMNAAAAGSTDIAYANVVGSSIFNIAVILAITALIRPVVIPADTRRYDYTAMLAALAFCLFLARDRLISQPEGAALLTGLIVFLAVTYVRARRAPQPPEAVTERNVTEGSGNKASQTWSSLGLLTVGIVGLWAGSGFMVTGAVTIAESWGISERVIGLTVIAMGTSLPELTTSIIAARQGEDEIALSNLMGSNIFNILAVLGGTSLLFPVPVNPQAASLDNWVMLGTGVVLAPILFTSKQVNRLHGILLLTGFLLYLWVLLAMG